MRLAVWREHRNHASDESELGQDEHELPHAPNAEHVEGIQHTPEHKKVGGVGVSLPRLPVIWFGNIVVCFGYIT